MGKNRDKHEQAEIIFKEICSGVYLVAKSVDYMNLLEYSTPKDVVRCLNSAYKVLVVDKRDLFIHSNYN